MKSMGSHENVNTDDLAPLLYSTTVCKLPCQAVLLSNLRLTPLRADLCIISSGYMNPLALAPSTRDGLGVEPNAKYCVVVSCAEALCGGPNA